MANREAMRQLLRLGPMPGMEMFEPSDAELQAEQRQSTVTTPSRVVRSADEPWSLGGGGSAVRGTSVIGGSSYTPSREQIRDAGMSRLRRTLGLEEIEHGREMEQEQLKGEYGIAGEVAGQQAAMDRLLTTQAGLDRRATQSNDTRTALAEERERSAMDRLIESLTGRREVEELRQGEMNKRAGAGESGWIQTLLGYLFGGREQDTPEPEGQVVPQATGRRPPRIVSVE